MFQRQRLGEILVAQGALSRLELDRALTQHAAKNLRIGEYLVQENIIQPLALSRALAHQADAEHQETIDVDSIDLNLLDNLPIAFARARLMLPMRRVDQGVEVAVTDPFDILGLDQVAAAINARVEPVVVPRQAITDAVNVAYDRHDRLKTRYSSKLEAEAKQKQDLTEPELGDAADLLDSGGDDEAPVIQFVSTTILRAVRDRASDIHVEPQEGRTVVRFRVDGVLQEVAEVPAKFNAAIVARIKVLAELNIAEKRLPQDGRIRIAIAGKSIDIRVATAPTSYGERVTMRILDKSAVMLDIDKIGMDPKTLEELKDMILRPYGIILVSGPTGSGKTTTLYSCLSKINTVDRNILTIEDPVEYQLNGISQIAVNHKIDLTFASGLRSFLRHDPDVIMVGEIRDGETAEIAIQASLTGHLVFSTVHTNDAAGAFTRLIDMGVEPFLVASSLLAIMAQRLVRRLCSACKESYEPTLAEIQKVELSPEKVAAAGGRFWRPVGCEACRGQGYRGRSGIYEFLIVTDQVRKLVMDRLDSGTIKKQALLDGMRTLRVDGGDKILQGVTSVDEVLRVTQSEVI